MVAGQAIRPRRQWSFSRHYSKQSKMGKEASIKGSECLIWKAEQSKIKFKETTAFLERWVLFDHNASVLLKSVPCNIFFLKCFFDNGRTQLLLPLTLNVAFRSFEPRIAEPFSNEQLLRKKKIVATERTIFHWEMALQFTVQRIWMPRSMSVAKVTEYVYYFFQKSKNECNYFLLNERF